MSYVIILNSCLSLNSVMEYGDRYEIWVMKNYGVKESWVKQFVFNTWISRSLMLPVVLQSGKISYNSKLKGMVYVSDDHIEPGFCEQMKSLEGLQVFRSSYSHSTPCFQSCQG